MRGRLTFYSRTEQVAGKVSNVSERVGGNVRSDSFTVCHAWFLSVVVLSRGSHGHGIEFQFGVCVYEYYIMVGECSVLSTHLLYLINKESGLSS